MTLNDLIKELNVVKKTSGNIEILFSRDEEGNSYMKRMVFGWLEDDKVIAIYPFDNDYRYV